MPDNPSPFDSLFITPEEAAKIEAARLISVSRRGQHCRHPRCMNLRMANMELYRAFTQARKRELRLHRALAHIHSELNRAGC